MAGGRLVRQQAMLVIELAGDLDGRALQRIGSLLIEAHPLLLAEKGIGIAIDLAAVQSATGEVIDLLAEIAAAAERDGHTLTLLGPVGDVREELDRAGIGHLIKSGEEPG